MSSLQKDDGNSSSWMSEDDKSCVQAMLIANAHVFPFVLKAAVELNLFEIIAKAGDGACISPFEMASQLPTRNPDAPSLIDRMLRLLASHGLVTCGLRTLEDGSSERVYGLTPTCKFFLRSDDGTSLASMVGYSGSQPYLEACSNMKDAVLKEGDHFKRVCGMSLYEYMTKDPTRYKAFNEGMARRSKPIIKKILEMYNGFEGLASLVDVGGGTGACLNMIISKYPSIKGINFDLPHVIQTAPTYPGIEHVGGNMLLSIPKANAIMMKSICHNWGDEQCLKILSNCYEALPKNGKVIVIELLMPEAPDSTMGTQFVTRADNAMIMLLEGKERTVREFETLGKRSGFSDFRVVYRAYGCLWSVMEIYK